MSRLETMGEQFRNALITKNEYDNNDQYNVGHGNALSDGDDNGKGEFNGNIGSATDINMRGKLLTKNKFNKNKEYNSGTA